MQQPNEPREKFTVRSYEPKDHAAVGRIWTEGFMELVPAITVVKQTKPLLGGVVFAGILYKFLSPRLALGFVGLHALTALDLEKRYFTYYLTNYCNKALTEGDMSKIGIFYFFFFFYSFHSNQNVFFFFCFFFCCLFLFSVFSSFF